jgi:hypothetical protein
MCHPAWIVLQPDLVIIRDARQRKAEKLWAELATPEYRRWIVDEVQRRLDDGDRRAAKAVAFGVLEDVWQATHFRRLSNLAYRRALTIGRSISANTACGAADEHPDRRAAGVEAGKPSRGSSGRHDGESLNCRLVPRP